MTIAPVQMAYGVSLQTASTQFYYAGSGIKITSATFTNITAAPVGLTVQTNANAGPVVTIIDNVQVPAHSSYLAPELTGLVLLGRNAVFAQATAANSINGWMNGVSFP